MHGMSFLALYVGGYTRDFACRSHHGIIDLGVGRQSVASFLDVHVHMRDINCRFSLFCIVPARVDNSSFFRGLVEAALNQRLDSVFERFDERPLGAASIGQVHRATLKEDGRDVVVKVTRE